MSATQEVLFPADPAPQPKLYDERFDWYEAYCRDRYSPPSDWQIYTWKANGEHDKPGCFVLVEGAVFKHTISKGKRKGRLDFKKPEHGSKFIFSILVSDLDKFKVEWSTRTGKCHECYGTGQEWHGWNHKTGNRFRDCRSCGASGKAALSTG